MGRRQLVGIRDQRETQRVPRHIRTMDRPSREAKPNGPLFLGLDRHRRILERFSDPDGNGAGFPERQNVLLSLVGNSARPGNPNSPPRLSRRRDVRAHLEAPQSPMADRAPKPHERMDVQNGKNVRRPGRHCGMDYGGPFDQRQDDDVGPLRQNPLPRLHDQWPKSVAYVDRPGNHASRRPGRLRPVLPEQNQRRFLHRVRLRNAKPS